MTRTSSAGSASATCTLRPPISRGRPDVDPERIGGDRLLGRRRDADPRRGALGRLQGGRLRRRERPVDPRRDRERRRSSRRDPRLAARSRGDRASSRARAAAEPEERGARRSHRRPASSSTASTARAGGDEAQPAFYAAAGGPKQIWEVPNGQHIAGITHRAGRVRAPRDRLLRQNTPREPSERRARHAAPSSFRREQAGSGKADPGGRRRGDHAARTDRATRRCMRCRVSRSR